MPLSPSTPLEPSRSPSTLRFNALDWVAFALMLVGSLNWGLVGFFGFDLVAWLFGEMSAASRAVYGLVGIAALYGLAMAARCARRA